jgi:hypothetical protein
LKLEVFKIRKNVLKTGLEFPSKTKTKKNKKGLKVPSEIKNWRTLVFPTRFGARNNYEKNISKNLRNY